MSLSCSIGNDEYTLIVHRSHYYTSKNFTQKGNVCNFFSSHSKVLFLVVTGTMNTHLFYTVPITI